MGAAISAVRKQIDHSDENREAMEQRLSILEKMVNYHLDTAKMSMLSGGRGDQEIHTGTVVEFRKQVNVSLSKGGAHGENSIEGMIKDFFGGQIMGGVEKLLLGGVETILGNATMGEHEDTSMYIVWSNNALLRLDLYLYRWNFSSKEVIQDVEGVTGVLAMTRVINLTKTDPQVLTWAISTQAHCAGDDANDLIDDAVGVIKKVSALQQAVQAIEVEEHSKGMSGKDD